MRPREGFAGAGTAPRVVAGLLAALAALGGTGGVVAQQTPELKREPPPAPAMVCPPDILGAQTDGPADPAVGADVERLTNAATQALILGDLDGADDFLARALEADPRSAEAAYLRGRIAAERANATSAAPWFCRYLELAPSGASAPEARRQLEAAVAEGAARPLYAAFETGVASYDAGDLAGADERFAWLLGERPGVAAAAFNRGLILATLRQPGPARGELERYLALEPDATDRAAVEELLLTLAGDRSAPSPTSAFLLGALLPGGGQYYTGRTGFGLVVTSLAAGAAAAGVLYQRTTVLCADASPGGDCPPGAVLGEETERPLLVAGLATAGGLALIAAIEAARHAGRDRRARWQVPSVGQARVEAGPGLAGVSAGGAPVALRLSLIRVRF